MASSLKQDMEQATVSNDISTLGNVLVVNCCGITSYELVN